MRALSYLASARPSTKTSLVMGGYLIAFAAAAAVVSVRVPATRGPEWQAYSGMLAFGDSLLFLAVFGLMAIAPTGAALFILRPYRPFWRVASAFALGTAATGIVALVILVASRGGVVLGEWSALLPLRVLLAPLIAGVQLLAGLLSPIRWCRGALLGACATELIVFAWAHLVSICSLGPGAVPHAPASIF